MTRESKDETRWLLRLFAILIIGLSIQGIRVQFRTISAGEEFSAISFILFIGIVLLLFWLAHWLWRCPSFWDIFSGLPQTPPLFLYCQSQYFRLNRHVRHGLVAGVILFIMECIFLVIASRHKGMWLGDCMGRAFGFSLWPLMAFWKLFNFPEWPRAFQVIIFFVSVLAYFFIVGFILCWCVSYTKARFIREREITNLYRHTE